MPQPVMLQTETKHLATRGNMGNATQKAVDRYHAANIEAATIIAADPVRYPLGGLMQEWADVILSKAAVPADAECGPLFQQRAA